MALASVRLTVGKRWKSIVAVTPPSNSAVAVMWSPMTTVPEEAVPSGAWTTSAGVDGRPAVSDDALTRRTGPARPMRLLTMCVPMFGMP